MNIHFLLWMNILNFKKVKFISIRSKLVFERLAYKVGMYIYTHTHTRFFFCLTTTSILDLSVYTMYPHDCTSLYALQWCSCNVYIIMIWFETGNLEWKCYMFHADSKRLPHTAVCSANADAAHCTWRRRAAESDVTVRLDLCNSWRYSSTLSILSVS